MQKSDNIAIVEEHMDAAILQEIMRRADAENAEWRRKHQCLKNNYGAHSMVVKITYYKMRYEALLECEWCGTWHRVGTGE